MMYWTSGRVPWVSQPGWINLLACFFTLGATDSSDSALVQHLLTSWQPAWQPSFPDPYTCKQALVGLESGIYHDAASQCETKQTLY